jgi:hypothetical protein
MIPSSKMALGVLGMFSGAGDESGTGLVERQLDLDIVHSAARQPVDRVDDVGLGV